MGFQVGKTFNNKRFFGCRDDDLEIATGLPPEGLIPPLPLSIVKNGVTHSDKTLVLNLVTISLGDRILPGFLRELLKQSFRPVYAKHRSLATGKNDDRIRTVIVLQINDDPPFRVGRHGERCGSRQQLVPARGFFSAVFIRPDGKPCRILRGDGLHMPDRSHLAGFFQHGG